MLFRRRAWHEQDSPRARGLKGLLRAVVGIGLPLALLVGFRISQAPEPPEPPPPPALGAAETTAAGAATPDGTWQVGPDSWVGYRIAEERPRRRGHKYEVVGRSRSVAGGLEIDATTVVAVEVAADLRELSSDRPWRERVLRNRYLHTERHPRASFELAEPLNLLALPAAGEPADVVVPGRLTLHGVTRPADVPLRVRWDGDRIRVVGTVEVVLDDYDIAPPRIPGFRFVDPVGDIELDLEFVPADAERPGAHGSGPPVAP